MKLIPQIYLVILLLTPIAQASVYKCLAESGRLSFSQAPCRSTEKTQTFKPSPISTKYIDIKNIQFKSKESNTKKEAGNDNCPFINSTELRNLRVKQQYIKGLPEKEIIKRFGQAHSISTNSTNISVWKYKSDSYKLEFTFKHGCLKKWKEKWYGTKSRIDKYREF